MVNKIPQDASRLVTGINQIQYVSDDTVLTEASPNVTVMTVTGKTVTLPPVASVQGRTFAVVANLDESESVTVIDNDDAIGGGDTTLAGALLVGSREIGLFTSVGVGWHTSVSSKT